MALGSFVKTAWNEGAAPGISAAELNRIEQGIADLDAVWTSGDLDITGAVRWTDAGPNGLEQYDITSGDYSILESVLYYRTTPKAWSFEDGSGNEILEVVTNATGQYVQSHKLHYFTPAGTIANDWTNYALAGLVVGNATKGVGVDDNEVVFGGGSGYINAPDGVLYLQVGGGSGVQMIFPTTVGTAVTLNTPLTVAGQITATSVPIRRDDGTYYQYWGSADATYARNYTNAASFYFNANVRANGGFSPYQNQVDDLGATALRFANAYIGKVFIGSTSGDDALGVVTGQYGSVQTYGAGAGGYEGYSIDGHTVFMASAATGYKGIYDDNVNQWMIEWHSGGFWLRHHTTGELILYAEPDARTFLYYNNVNKLATDSYGVYVTGVARLSDGGTVQVNGTMYQGNGSWGCYYETDEPSSGIDSISTTYSSSARYKRNISPHTLNPRAVLDAKLREWDWDRDTYEMVHGIRPRDPAHGRPMGLVADEVYEVEPRLVATNLLGEPERILDGKPLQDAMLAALQHLDGRVAALEGALS